MKNEKIGVCYVCRNKLIWNQYGENCEYIEDVYKRIKCPHCGTKYEYHINGEYETCVDNVKDQGFGNCILCSGFLAWSGDFMRSDFDDTIKDEKDDAIVRNMTCSDCGCTVDVYEPSYNEIISGKYPYWKESPKTAIALSQKDFNKICEINKWTDDNVETLTDKAFISIIPTDECQKFYLGEDMPHWFGKNHPNVLNISFDDITEDKDYNGHSFKAMTEEQAQEIFEFIEANIGKDIYCHCTAGVSRSGAVISFISQMYSDSYNVTNDEIQRIRPNTHVLALLKRCFYQKHNCFGLDENNEKKKELTNG